MVGASAANFTITKPTGLANDDMLYVGFYIESDAAITAPSGFSTKGNSEQNLATHEHRYYLYEKRITNAAGEPADYTFSWTGAVWREAVCFAVVGAKKTGNPFNTALQTAASGASQNTTPAVSLTSTVDECLLIWFGSCFAGGSWTQPTGWILQYNSGSDHAFATLGQSTQGATGTITGSYTGGASGTTGLLAAIEPAAPEYEQEGFRFRNDDGSETAATWAAAQDTNISAAAGIKRLRMLTDEKNVGNPPATRLKMQYRKVGDDGWRDLKP